MNDMLPSPLRGIVVPMVTPLVDRDKLDEPGLERLIEHILAGGVQGLFVLGTTGEAPSLSYRLREELIRRTCAQVAGRVPVLVGITDTAFCESIRMAETAAEAGAAGVVMAPPYYFPAGQPELLQYVEHALPHLPLPLLLYNMPSMTKIAFDPDTVRQVARLPGVAGLKDSSGNMVYFHCLRELLAEHPAFTLMVGPEELLGEAVLLGAHGGVNGGANVWPHLYTALYNAAAAGDIERVRELHTRVIHISMTVYRVGQHGSSFVKGLKCALSCLGICNDFVAEPFHRFRHPEREKVERYLRELNLANPDFPDV